MRRVVLILALTLLIAGCTSPAKPTCQAPQECPTTANSSTPTNGGGGPGDPPVNVTLPKIVFENCWGVSYSFEIPADAVTDDVPDEFGPASGVPFFASLFVEGLHCARIVSGNETVSGVAFMWSAMSVVPKNSSWDEGGFAAYAYDVITTNQTVASMLERAGVAATVGEFNPGSTPGPGGVTLETWTFSTAAVTYDLHFYHDSEAQAAPFEQDRFHWSGPGPFTRTDLHQAADLFMLSPGTGAVEIEGTSAFANAVTSPIAPTTGSAIFTLTWEMEPTPKVFN